MRRTRPTTALSGHHTDSHFFPTRPHKPHTIKQQPQQTNKQTNTQQTGWIEAPTTGAYEFGLDSDDGSDFAMSLNGVSFEIVASWCVVSFGLLPLLCVSSVCAPPRCAPSK